MPFLNFFTRSNTAADAVHALYAALVQKARDPKFYIDYGVPDTVDGRFDMIVIHAMLVMRRLREDPEQVHTTGQRLFDLMFTDMDRSLREMGVGDMSVGKHVKKMARAFYGRAAAYEAGMDGSAEDLRRALGENLFRHGEPSPEAIDGVGDYLRRASGHLAGQPLASISAGKVDFSVPV